jgi:hypothetical protein
VRRFPETRRITDIALLYAKKTSNMASNKVLSGPCKVFGFLIEFLVPTRFGRAITPRAGRGAVPAPLFL